MKKYSVIGLMSGTSLDGLDIVFCEFYKNIGEWKFNIKQAETTAYSTAWKETLLDAPKLPDVQIKKLDISYGKYLAEETLTFIKKHSLNPDFIASHGHTIFHQPEKRYTLQIGNGKSMAQVLGLPVIFDFRSLDVSHGGQGAPLVPIGDKLLFNEFDFCINLGGIANISYDENGKRIAYDICPANMALNHFSKQEGLEFDIDGQLASRGNFNVELFEILNKIPFYQQKAPKSLSREWFESEFLPLINIFEISVNDFLNTLTEHIAFQISNSLISKNKATILLTGGGAHNTYLANRIQLISNKKVVIPEDEIIDFKEAIIFGFLGVLRMRNEINCLSSVTGASQDCSGGEIAYP